MARVRYIDYYYSNSRYPCDDNCCEDYKQNPEKSFFIAIMNAGYFLFYQQSIGFGTFLANFANLTSAIIGVKDYQCSIFDLDVKMKLPDQLSGHATVCDELSSMDEFLNEYFQNLSTAIGFTENHSFSLFDVPSMFRAEMELENLRTHRMLTKEVFLYSQCQKRKVEKDFHPCFHERWSTYINYDTDGM